MSPCPFMLLLAPSGGKLPHRPLPCYTPTTNQSDFLLTISKASPLRIVPRIASSFELAANRISQVPTFPLHDHATAYDPGREHCISPSRCSTCCLPHDAKASASTIIGLRGSIPSLALRPDHPLLMASPARLPLMAHYLVTGEWLALTCVGL